jgi:peptidoglycan hydrolase-like protein with peptidoglycan-binding domain
MSDSTMRDLASAAIWEESLTRSRARRARTARGLTAPANLIEVHQRPEDDGRDLLEPDPWDLSIGRSRARRRHLELQFVPGGRRARRLAFGTLAALTAGPAGALADSTSSGAPAPTPTTTATDVTPTATHEHTVLLTEGSTGRSVRAVQRALGITDDGIFGPHTEAAVIAFQAANHLTEDGVVGPETTAALRTAGPTAPQQVEANEAAATQAPVATTPAPARASHAAKVGASHLSPQKRSAHHATGEVAAVMRLQHALGVTADGSYGPVTLAAVRRLQVRDGLDPDGVVGQATWRALGLRAGGTIAPSPGLLGGGASMPTGEAVGPSTVEPTDQTEPGEPVKEVIPHSLRVQTSGTGGAAFTTTTTDTTTPSTTTTTTTIGGSTPTSSPSAPGAPTNTADLPVTVQNVIAAANRIATTPYVYGGGHQSFNSPEGYDCSGSVSYALHGGGLISSPEDSTQLESYGSAGPGKYITIYANAGHTYMTLGGKRFDTGAQSSENGNSRWGPVLASNTGFVVRHPTGY